MSEITLIQSLTTLVAFWLATEAMFGIGLDYFCIRFYRKHDELNGYDPELGRMTHLKSMMMAAGSWPLIAFALMDVFATTMSDVAGLTTFMVLAVATLRSKVVSEMYHRLAPEMWVPMGWKAYIGLEPAPVKSS